MFKFFKHQKNLFKTQSMSYCERTVNKTKKMMPVKVLASKNTYDLDEFVKEDFTNIFFF